MEELEIQGKKYISSKRASEITGYAKDYVGQLARGGKVPAQRVGRSWYVDEEEIRRHAGINAPADIQVAESSVIQAETDATAIPPVAATARLVALNTLQARQSENGALFKTWGNICYLSDGAGLFPKIVAGGNKNAQDEHKGGHQNAGNQPIVIKKKMSTGHPVVRHASPVSTTLSIDGIAVPTFGKPSAPTTALVAVSPISAVPHRTPERRSSGKASGMRAGTALVAVSFSLVIALGVIGGTVLPSEWYFTDQGIFTANTAELTPALDAFKALFTEIFGEGLGLITNFLVFVFQSPRELFDSGVEFIIHILNLG